MVKPWYHNTVSKRIVRKEIRLLIVVRSNLFLSMLNMARRIMKENVNKGRIIINNRIKTMKITTTKMTMKLRILMMKRKKKMKMMRNSIIA
jgi:hypothetical protein